LESVGPVGSRGPRYGPGLQHRTVLYGAFGTAETGYHSASATRMRPSPSLRCTTTRRLSTGNLTPSPAALITIIVIIRLSRNLHGEKVICRHGFVVMFISRHRRLSEFNWNLAESGSPCFTGLSLDFTDYGHPFSRVRTRGRSGESAAQGNSRFF
jgi:hypothetical protein